MSAPDSLSSRLRHRLTLQQEVRTPDTAGGFTRSWNDVADLWAEIIPLTGTRYQSESVFGAQVQAESTHRILLRYRDGIAAGMRLVFDDRIFNIRGVANLDERNEMLSLLVTEGVAA